MRRPVPLRSDVRTSLQLVMLLLIVALQFVCAASVTASKSVVVRSISHSVEQHVDDDDVASVAVTDDLSLVDARASRLLNAAFGVSPCESLATGLIASALLGTILIGNVGIFAVPMLVSSVSIAGLAAAPSQASDQNCTVGTVLSIPVLLLPISATLPTNARWQRGASLAALVNGVTLAFFFGRIVRVAVEH